MDNELTSNTPGLDLDNKEGIVYEADPLALDVKDEDLVAIIDKRIDDSHTFFKKHYDLYERRKKNETYVFGRQIGERESRNDLKIYEARYLDNVLYEIEAAIKPLAMSRLPDLIVTPGTEGDDAKNEEADNVGKIVDNDIKRRENRTVLGIAFRHHPVYFTGIIKCLWIPEKDDYEFKVVHPDYAEVDHTCQTNNADDMNFIAETLPITIQECFIRFPSKKTELLDELRKNAVLPEDPNRKLTNKDLATQIQIREVWFDTEQPKEGEDEKYETISGVIWKYRECVLKKIKNPNFDWEGEEKHYSYEKEGEKPSRREIGQEDVMKFMMTGEPPPNMTKEKVFRNYFEFARKPYFFFSYDQWRKMPYDETSRVEQNIRNQEALDKSGKRLIEKLEKRTKHIWSKEGGITQKIIEKTDLDDPRQDMVVEGNVNNVHSAILPEQVTPPEFKFPDDTRQRMYSLAGASAVRGEVQSDVATTNQIAREADFTRADDLVDETINAACEWMAVWSLQMIKLRYTDYHFRKVLGAKGSTTFIKLRNDMIDDGMEVLIKASGTDKVKIKNQAMDLAKLQMIDPLTMFEDLGVSDPKERTLRLMTLQSNPQEYMLKYAMDVEDTSTAGLGALLNGQPPAGATPPGAPPVPPPNGAPQAPSPMNTGAAPVAPPTGPPSGSPRIL